MNFDATSAPAVKLLAANRPLLIGHRGFCAEAPENTLPSFKCALAAGVDLVELDYQHSQDGVPMVIHDRTLDRTTDARKKWKRSRIRVAEKTAAELQSLDAGRWFNRRFAGTTIPRLAEALEYIAKPGGIALVEHKSGDPGTLVRLLREHGLVNRVVIISFDWSWLAEFHHLEPDQLIGALGPPVRLANGRKPRRFLRGPNRDRLEEIVTVGAKVVVWNRHASGTAIRFAHQLGLNFWVYTINDRRSARILLDRQVDGIISNVPLRLKPVVTVHSTKRI